MAGGPATGAQPRERPRRRQGARGGARPQVAPPPRTRAQASPGPRLPGGTAAPAAPRGSSLRRRDGRAAAERTLGGPAGQPAGQNAPDAQNDPIPAGFAPRRPQRLQYSAPSVDGGTHVETSQGPGVNDEFARAGRNDPCPCGSGRKFKRCHGDPRARADG